MHAHDTVTTPERPQLRQYQYFGVCWLVEKLKKHKAVLLADDAGLGKTLQTLGAADRLKAHRLLIICPAGARRVWLGEIARWYPQWLDRVELLEPGADLDSIDYRLRSNDPLILIVGYDDFSTGSLTAIALSGQSPLLGRGYKGWHLLVLDECHYLKNHSKRTKAIYGPRGDGAGVQSEAWNVILLSGTPTPNHCGELYEHIRTFWPWAAPNLTLAQFEERYCRYKDTVYGRQITGSKNQKVLGEALKEVVLRRRKQQVLPELPPLIIQDAPLVPADAGPIDLDFFDNFALAVPDDDDGLIEATNVAELRKQLGLAKVQAIAAWVRERMQSTHKLLLFCWHLEVIERLRQSLQEFEPVVIVGGTSPKDRTLAIGRFQSDPNTRLFIGQTLAAGTAITLTAASEVAIAEPSWVPGENHQAICRAHRLGQRDSVLASFLYLPDTLDERIMQAFRRKAREISELEGV